MELVYKLVDKKTTQEVNRFICNKADLEYYTTKALTLANEYHSFYCDTFRDIEEVKYEDMIIWVNDGNKTKMSVSLTYVKNTQECHMITFDDEYNHIRSYYILENTPIEEWWCS